MVEEIKKREIKLEITGTINKENYLDKLQDRLQLIRSLLNLSQKEISEEMGISRPTWSKLETKKIVLNKQLAMSLFMVAAYAVKDKDKETQKLLAVNMDLEKLDLNEYMDKIKK